MASAAFLTPAIFRVCDKIICPKKRENSIIALLFQSDTDRCFLAVKRA